MAISTSNRQADAANQAVTPVHGVVASQPDLRHVVAHLDGVPLMRSEATHAFRLDSARALAPGTRFDALEQNGVLREVTASNGYVAGIPDDRPVSPLNVGDALPAMSLVDQRGRLLNLSKAWLGKTVVLSFVFTRCPDALICPAISGKFAYLQDHLDGAKTHLVEITLDPKYDSPKVLQAYAIRFGAVPEQWSIVTGEQNQIGLLINRFGLSNLEDRPGNFEHDDTLAIVNPQGVITDLIPTVGWSPDDVIATVLHAQGHETNPLRRLELAAIAGVVSLCGGSTTTGQVMLDSAVFAGGVLFFGALLYLFGRRIWKQDP